jgi:hypothetical protein
MKKSITTVIAVIVGLVGGYLLCKTQQSHSFDDEKQAFIKKFIDTNKFVFAPGNRGVITDPATVASMRQQFRDDNTNLLLLGRDGNPLKGYYIDTADIKEILRSPNKYSGISFYLGKHPDHLGSKHRVYTLMFMGAKANPTQPGKPFSYSDDATRVYDHVSVCPDECGTF